MANRKRYALFAGYRDEGSGWDSYQATSDSIAELKSMMRQERSGSHWFHVAVTRKDAIDFCSWWQIVDLDAMEVVDRGNGKNLQ